MRHTIRVQLLVAALISAVLFATDPPDEGSSTSSVWLLDNSRSGSGGEQDENKPDLLIQPLPPVNNRKRASYTLRLCNGHELTAMISEAEDRGGLGDRVWSSAMALSIWMTRPEQQPLFGGKRVLELGSGVGLAGVVASLLPNNGARPASVLLSDHSKFLLDAIEENLLASAELTYTGALASGGGGAVTVAAGGGTVLDNSTAKVALLNWDHCQDSSWTPPETARDVDVIIAADVIYNPAHAIRLLQCFHRLLRPDGKGRVVVAQPSSYRSGWDELKEALNTAVSGTAGRAAGGGSVVENALELRVEGANAKDMLTSQTTAGRFTTRFLVYTPPVGAGRRAGTHAFSPGPGPEL